MRAFQPIKRLLKSERGNALAIGAAMMPLLLASAGFAIDTTQIALLNRQIQRAADSSALAGAYALAQDTNSTTEAATARAAVARDLTKNKYPTLAQAATVTPGPALGWQRTVAVQLEARPRLPFMSIFTKSGSVVRANATAAIVNNGRFCMLSLFNGTSPGISVGGSAELNLGCGLASKGTGPDCVDAFGSSRVIASPIMAVGGVQGSSNFASGTKLQPHSSEQRDPYASVPNPPAFGGCPEKTVGPGETFAIPPGACYSSLTIKGNVTTSGPVYIDGGDLDITSQANISGTNTTFVMTGPNGAAGDLSMNGNATMNISAPGSGDYKNILFYRDRRASNIEIKINGGSDMTMAGAFYFPSSDVTFTGGSSFNAQCFQLIGQILTFRGNADITNACTVPGLTPTFQLEFVRLVK